MSEKSARETNQSPELSDEDLDGVAGGATTSRANAELFKSCCNGSHLPAVQFTGGVSVASGDVNG